MRATTCRGCRVAIGVEHEGPHLVVMTLDTGSVDSPFLRMESKVTTIGISEDMAREVAMATGVRWIDATLPNVKR